MNNILTSERVSDTIKACLYQEGTFEKVEDLPDGAIVVEGVMNLWAFDPLKIKENEETIREMLAEMPKEFHASSGGGHSLLTACMDKHGNHWGEHPSIDQLMVLGMAIKAVTYTLPRGMWSALPGNVPYYTINLEKNFD